MTRRRSKMPESAAVENRILDALDRILARDGYAGLALRDVAEESGLTTTVLYLHFRNKADLILGHADRLALCVLAGERAIALSKTAPITERIRELLSYRVMAHFDGVQHFSESHNEIMREMGPILSARREDFMPRETVLLRGLLDEGQRTGVLRRQNSQHTSFALLSLTQGLLPFSVSFRSQSRRSDLEKQTARIIDLLMHSLLANPITRNSEYMGVAA